MCKRVLQWCGRLLVKVTGTAVSTDLGGSSNHSNELSNMPQGMILALRNVVDKGSL